MVSLETAWEMMNVDRFILLDCWQYSAPAQEPNKEGDTVLIRASSIAPLESWEWGVDREGRPYEQHQWLENDFYEDENVRRAISREELLETVDDLIRQLREKQAEEWAEVYAHIRRRIETSPGD